MSRQHKHAFETRPDHLIADFWLHLETTGEPHTWRFHTDQAPPPDDVQVLIANFLLPKGKQRAPCPICRREKQYLKGHVLWSPTAGTVHAVGHCCGHRYFRDDALTFGLKEAAERKARREHEAFLWANWDLPQRLVVLASPLVAQARSYDRVVKSLRSGITPHVSRSIYRMASESGFLQVAREFSAVGSSGLRSVSERFGRMPIQGGRVLKVSRSDSLEARTKNAVAPFASLNWEREDDAVWWLCGQPHAPLKQLDRWLHLAVETIDDARDAITSLTYFLEPEHLEMVSQWSSEVHGENALRLFRHGDDSLTIWRGHDRVRNILLPRNIWEVNQETIEVRPPKEGLLGS